MRITKAVETEEGGVTFSGELVKDELDLVISVGLNYLIKSGALPLKVLRQEDRSTVVPGTETEQ